jgi:hypothetical protein
MASDDGCDKVSMRARLNGKGEKADGARFVTFIVNQLERKHCAAEREAAIMSL